MEPNPVEDLTIEDAISQADGHAARINAPGVLPAFDDPDDEDKEDED